MKTFEVIILVIMFQAVLIFVTQPFIKDWAYRLLRSDIIERLRKKDWDCINDVLEAFGLSMMEFEEMPHYKYTPPPPSSMGEYNSMLVQIEQLKSKNHDLRVTLNEMGRELHKLKNPPPVPKYKAGDRAGNFAIWNVEPGYPEPGYRCINANGEFSMFRESQVEAMMKLNPDAPQKVN